MQNCFLVSAIVLGFILFLTDVSLTGYSHASHVNFLLQLSQHAHSFFSPTLFPETTMLVPMAAPLLRAAAVTMQASGLAAIR